jgi:Carbohydrate/starch-binding module (family 21)
MDVTVSPVKLKYAIAQSVEVDGVNIAYTYVKVKVQNLNEPKTVEILYKDAAGSWVTAPIDLASHYGDYDIFESINAPYTAEFAIRYTVDGVDYWDSNYGANYKLVSHRDNIIGANVILNKATVKTDINSGALWLEGEIYVKKISFNKRIGIIFSGDDGKSWSETNATYQGVETEGAYDTIFNPTIEVWKYKTPAQNYPIEPDYLRLAVYYKNDETGEAYWDNNFGQDYKVSKASGSTIE